MMVWKISSFKTNQKLPGGVPLATLVIAILLTTNKLNLSTWLTPNSKHFEIPGTDDGRLRAFLNVKGHNLARTREQYSETNSRNVYERILPKAGAYLWDKKSHCQIGRVDHQSN